MEQIKNQETGGETETKPDDNTNTGNTGGSGTGGSNSGKPNNNGNIVQ